MKACIALIEKLDPIVYFIENPRDCLANTSVYRCAFFVGAMKWGLTEGPQKVIEDPQKTPDFRKIGLKNSQTLGIFEGLKRCYKVS